MADIKALVAGANPMMRKKLCNAIAMSGSGITVIAEASDLPETYTRAEAMEPRVVLVAKELVALAEFSLMKSLFRALNSIWITVDHRGVGPNALPDFARGSNEIGVPVLDTGLGAAEICRQIIAAASMAAQPLPPRDLAVPLAAGSIKPGKLILLGASTGGVDALLAVLAALPANCPPVAVVQHTGQGFSESLIRLLARRCTLRVEAAQHGMELKSGVVAVAAGCAAHMRLRSGAPYRISLEPGPLISGHLPSVDALFHSAVPIGKHVVAGLLTGMGRDGAEGLLALRKAGAATVGQDESSSVVYGMPRAAWEIGAVRQQVPLSDIAATIVKACATRGVEGRVLL